MLLIGPTSMERQTPARSSRTCCTCSALLKLLLFFSRRLLGLQGSSNRHSQKCTQASVCLEFLLPTPDGSIPERCGVAQGGPFPGAHLRSRLRSRLLCL